MSVYYKGCTIEDIRRGYAEYEYKGQKFSVNAQLGKEEFNIIWPCIKRKIDRKVGVTFDDLGLVPYFSIDWT